MSGIVIGAPRVPGDAEILAPRALEFVAALHRRFEPRRRELLGLRAARQRDIAAGRMPDFLSETRAIRETEWRVAPIPRDLGDRRVEITGPVDRKMIINALNSGAQAFMADFEDANSPTWANTVEGQQNLLDAVRRTISYTGAGGKAYALGPNPATLIVRPRGWHMVERHMCVDGPAVSAALFDFGLCFFHTAQLLLDQGSGPYYYLPKLEGHLEARLWNDVFVAAQDLLGIARGTIRATVLIETILAAFEMDEILFELREHAAGLNCGRWDYIFSFIKKFSDRPDFLLPDRARVTMDRHFLRSYVDLLIRTCHRRGAYAIGGMAAQIPIRGDDAANAAALEKVRQDKLREVRAGHDGTWVAHPGLVPVVREVFETETRAGSTNQLGVSRADVHVTAADLLRVPEGDISLEGLRTNIDVAVRYLEAWLRGIGCVPIYNLMEDTATAEISRSQVWQWIRHEARLAGGPAVTAALVRELLASVVRTIDDKGKLELATTIFSEVALGPTLPEFLTTVASDRLERP